ncbi:GAF domain-containing protein [Leptolyngbya sp. FACHB-541]|uniref:GAF domain-containing protein n=1 Tax=Leptolyngbya sp. FACHB-541 TaxID=2692810 RepID=UPI0016888F98|nr:GAF domain-containing protein [Leptolyngbya sp. FACHB-541]MBD1998433.1 GAF domain-containing protein [Leptolyngbya sp. FACHB-541]
MSSPTIQTDLQDVWLPDEPDAVFSALLPALGKVLECDRCFLYLRNPESKMGMVPYCWIRSDEIPTVLDSDWKAEPESLPEEDPLFAAALRTEASVFVEDVETADPKVVNLAFEQREFGHRALIHAHLCQDGQLWGILQPCVFGQPRVWTDLDHTVIDQVVQKITPLAIAYIQTAATESEAEI